jgi:hypothetical protein
MAAAFKHIVIKSREELNAIIERFNDVGNNWAEDLIEAAEYIQNPSLEQQLEAWTRDHGIDLCDTGTDKVLKAAKAGKITTWTQYFEKYWNDGDGILGWFEQESEALVGQYVDTTRVVKGTEDSLDGEEYEDYPTFASFRKANPGLTFIDWPFKKVAKKKSTKKSKRK